MKNYSLFFAFFLVAFISFATMAQSTWILQRATGLPSSVNPQVVFSAVDENVCWGINTNNTQYLRTTNGGTNWTVSTITGATGSGSSISAIDANTACVAMSSGIFKTTDGGLTWAKQTSAFSGSGGHPNVIHFFDANNGVCAGDPRNGYWEIYTTTDGGAFWSRVPSGNIPAPLSGEGGISGNEARVLVGNSFWFSTWTGSLYRTTDRGNHWTVAHNIIGNAFDFAFKDSLNGLACTFINSGNDRHLSRTSDGGVTWTPILPVPSGLSSLTTFYIAYVKGSIGSYVITSNKNAGGNTAAFPGSAYSNDDGTTWTKNSSLQLGPATFVSDRVGWSGGINDSVYKWIGLPSAIPTAGLELWLKGDAGVDVINGTVSKWHDQSINGNDVVQTNTSRQPQFVSNLLNGKPIISFDGVNDKLGFTGSTLLSQFSLFLVINNHHGTNGNEGNVITFGPNGDFGHQFFMGMAIPEFGSDTLGMFTGNGWVRGGTPGLVALDQWRNLSVVNTGTIWSTTLQWNGIDVPLASGGTASAISIKLGDATGSGGGIGGANGVPAGTIYAKCDVAELIIYNRTVTDSERTAIENYLAVKYNISNPSIPTDSLQLWLKADEGVTLNGSTVSSWIDQSVNGNNALQSTTNRQPLLVNNALNGKPVLHFDGINDRLALTDSTTMSKLSLFLVFKIDSGLVGNNGTDPLPYYPIKLNGYGLSMRNFFSSNSPNLIDPFVGEESWVHAQAPNIAAYNQWKVLNVVANQTMWNTTVRSNGVDAVITPQGTSSSPLSVSLGRQDGSDGIGGADNVPAGHLIFKGDIAEVIVYNKVLSDSERSDVENYLADKYNITIITGIDDSQQGVIPDKFTLSQNYPNPFNPSTTIRFQIPNSSFVNLKVYDILGNEVATLVNEEKSSGSYEANWNASNLSSGVYFCKLQAGSFVETRKMILLK